MEECVVWSWNCALFAWRFPLLLSQRNVANRNMMSALLHQNSRFSMCLTLAAFCTALITLVVPGTNVGHSSWLLWQKFLHSRSFSNQAGWQARSNWLASYQASSIKFVWPGGGEMLRDHWGKCHWGRKCAQEGRQQALGCLFACGCDQNRLPAGCALLINETGAFREWRLIYLIYWEGR